MNLNNFGFMMIGLLGTMATTNAKACIPPPPNTPAYQIQKNSLSKLIDDPVVEKTINQLEGKAGTIQSIVSESGGYIITTYPSICSFVVQRDFSKASPGTCPELLPWKVDRIACD